MKARNLITMAAAAAATLLSAPVLADTGNTPPGNPCLENNGNPCNGNNGNLGNQGNANHERVQIDKKPPPINLPMPAVSGREAYISQIGDGNVTSIRQAAPAAYARVEQRGTGNEVDVTQSGSGTGYALASQSGDTNFARVQQSGSGQNVLYLDQTGTSNWAWSSQNASGALHNGARMAQSGNHNDMQLVQDGSDNRALLTQTGDANGMSAVQVGAGNRLIWNQQGNNLTDLQIIQTGGSEKGGQLQITQTGG